MEFGSYNNHYFYDVDLEEDFYRSIAPSEDIWKKFELVPNCSLSTLGCPGGGGKDWGTELMDLGWESPVKLPGLSSVVLLRDCMWSGFSTRERLEKVINERLSTGTPRATNAPKPATDSDLLEPVADIPEQSPPALLVPASMTDKIAPSSGSESASDSEDDEIDVVTVEKRKSYGGRKPVTITVRADPMDPGTKHFHISIHQQQHNYAACFPPEPSIPSPQHSPCPSPAQSPCEEEHSEVSSPSLPPSSPPAMCSPQASCSSDGEDMVKRKNHNYLERKRRNDLRSRFLALRDEVPSLSDTSKTPKVVILSRATEHLRGLLSAEQRLEAEKLRLRSRQQQLLRKLSRLKGR